MFMNYEWLWCESWSYIFYELCADVFYDADNQSHSSIAQWDTVVDYQSMHIYH